MYSPIQMLCTWFIPVQIVSKWEFYELESTYPTLALWRILSSTRAVSNNVGDDQAIASITISSDKPRLRTLRPLSHLINNCVYGLTGDFSTSNRKSVKDVLDRGIALCDALEDKVRAEVLMKAACTLIWITLRLDCKTVDLYRRLNQELGKIDRCLPIRLVGHGEARRIVLSTERRQAERDRLETQGCRFA